MLIGGDSLAPCLSAESLVVQAPCADFIHSEMLRIGVVWLSENVEWNKFMGTFLELQNVLRFGNPAMMSVFIPVRMMFLLSGNALVTNRPMWEACVLQILFTQELYTVREHLGAVIVLELKQYW